MERLENKEILLRECPNCGRLISAERAVCDCGYYFQTRYYKAMAEPSNAPSETRISSLLISIGSVLCVIVMIVLAVASFSANSPSVEATPSPVLSTPQPQPSPTLRPENTYSGKMYREPSFEGQCPLTIDTPPGSGGYYVYLRYLSSSSRSWDDRVQLVKLNKWNTGNGNDIAFYVAAGESFSIDVPVGVYKFSYAYGETWYGEKLYFGENTLYYKSDDLLEFYTEQYYTNGHTISLIMQTNGNFDTDPTTIDKFPA